MTTMNEAVRNGVDTRVLFATLDAVKQQPELGRFQFRASNVWIDGAHNRSTIQGFYGAGREDTSRSTAFHLDAGEPPVLLGTNTGANPAEALLHALAACLTTSLVYVAAARSVRLGWRQPAAYSVGTGPAAACSAGAALSIEQAIALAAPHRTLRA